MARRGAGSGMRGAGGGSLKARKRAPRALRRGAGAKAPSPEAKPRSGGATIPVRPEREAIVVKLGGSLEDGADLKRWARIVARAGRPVVVVPGGGAFAEAVRSAQLRQRFSDVAAHRMAILAMHQTGLMLIALEQRFVAAETVAEMRAAWTQARIPVWLPLRMADRDRAIPTDWTITSDGLAARLAERLGAAAVCLVKSRCVALAATAAQLADDGVVDGQFPLIVARGDIVWRVLGPGEERQLARALRVPPASARIVPAKPRAAGRRRSRPMLGGAPKKR